MWTAREGSSSIRDDCEEASGEPACAFSSTCILPVPDCVIAGQPVSTRPASSRRTACWRGSIRWRRTWWWGCPTRGWTSRHGVRLGVRHPLRNEGLVKNRYVGRTFIQPGSAQNRELRGATSKLSPLRSPRLRARRVVVIDDSIVRGTTSQPVGGPACGGAEGAKEVHMRVSCTRPCSSPRAIFGTDIPDQAGADCLVTTPDRKITAAGYYRGGQSGLSQSVDQLAPDCPGRVGADSVTAALHRAVLFLVEV